MRALQAVSGHCDPCETRGPQKSGDTRPARLRGCAASRLRGCAESWLYGFRGSVSPPRVAIWGSLAACPQPADGPLSGLPCAAPAHVERNTSIPSDLHRLHSRVSATVTSGAHCQWQAAQARLPCQRQPAEPGAKPIDPHFKLANIMTRKRVILKLIPYRLRN